MARVRANLFLNLFDYRPRDDGGCRREDFLTAAFAYLLQSQPRLCASWIQWLFPATEVEERSAHVANWLRLPVTKRGGVTAIPDMVIQFISHGAPMVVLFEHKWEAGVSDSQLQTYRAIEIHGVIEIRLVFIGGSEGQQRQAARHCDRSISWGDVRSFLRQQSCDCHLINEFVEFLTAQGLGPKREFTMKMRDACMSLCNLLRRKPWEVLPNRFRRHRNVTNRWGRFGVEFGQWIPVTEPGLLAGILYDGADHKIEVIDQSLGLDLILTIDVGNTGRRLPLDVLSNRSRELLAVNPDLQIRAGYECRNHKQDLVVQQPLSNTLDSLGGTADEAEAVYATFARWCQVLFGDGSLEGAINATWPVVRRGIPHL